MTDVSKVDFRLRHEERPFVGSKRGRSESPNTHTESARDILCTYLDLLGPRAHTVCHPNECVALIGLDLRPTNNSFRDVGPPKPTGGSVAGLRSRRRGYPL